MEETNNATMVAEEILQNTIVQNFAHFRERLGNVVLFDTTDLHLKMTNNIGTATVPMRRQHMAEDFINEVINMFDVNILFAYKTPDGGSFRMMAYTMPYQDEMYIIYTESEQYGIIEEMHVAFFESMDVMFEWLFKEHQKVEKKTDSLDVLQLQSLTDLYRNFV